MPPRAGSLAQAAEKGNFQAARAEPKVRWAFWQALSKGRHAGRLKMLPWKQHLGS